jgi:SNF2 family DNA or RNA helicase
MLSKKDITPEQDKAIDAIYGGNILLIAEGGFGKAMVGQSAAQELIADKELKRVLIVAPLSVCDLTWREEWRKWSHLNEPAMAIGTAPERKAAIASDATLVVINIENFKWFLETYPEHNFDGLLIDEISKFKMVSGATMKLLRWRLGEFIWRAGMTATPVNESTVDLYAQIMIVDAGKTLGRSQEKFRREFFMQADFKGYKWEFQNGGAIRLAEKLKHVIFVADGTDYAASLPDVYEELVEVELSKANRELYRTMAGELLLEIEGKEIEAANLAVMTGKLQQLANGFIYDEDGEAIALGTRKHKRLREWLAKPEQLVIVYQWDYEKAILESLGVPIFARDKKGLKAKWDKQEIQHLALHPKSASHGLNLQAGGFKMLIMSPFWSSDNWEQIFLRIWRRGQPSAYCERIVLVAVNTVEELALQRLETKKYNALDFIAHLRNCAKP